MRPCIPPVEKLSVTLRYLIWSVLGLDKSFLWPLIKFAFRTDFIKSGGNILLVIG